jgi:hypothetical protein
MADGGGDAGPDPRNEVVGKDLGESGDDMVHVRRYLAMSLGPSFVYMCMYVCMCFEEVESVTTPEASPEIGRHE